MAKKTLNPRIGVMAGSPCSVRQDLSSPGTTILKNRSGHGCQAQKTSSSPPAGSAFGYSRLLFPDREVVLAGGRIGEALSAAQGDVILCGLPALILKYIDPHILDGTGFATVEELAASPAFLPVAEPVLAAFGKKYPRVRVVLVNRDGKIIAESP